MKKHLLSLVLLCAVFTAPAQTGLIAHWDFNGESNDVSGNGHTGHALNTIDTTGMTGAVHTAYYFNGTNSIVTAPYKPDLNLTKFSICAVLKPIGFYSGSCLSNTIFTRGREYPIEGVYSLYFTNVINECSTYDSSKESFGSEAGTDKSASTITGFNDSPWISKNVWYKVVVTYDSTYWRVYVNGVFLDSVAGAGSPIGNSTDSVSIGMSIYDVINDPAYPYNFKGFIDDIRLYNRVLSDSEITHYSPLAINDPVSHRAISVYPNPAYNEITIENSENNTVAIYNSIGQKVYEGYIANQIQKLDIKNFTNGVYIMQITNSAGYKESLRFIKM
ncbi:MAG TPA: LamG-like jellyroll fold domain-containing protein [Flavipsychrobacter sp.]|nr:LamG-like jellyroll fold domain-containing protein [Flavipsychrobacter sp.]